MYVLWGQNTVSRGLYDITNAGVVNLGTPRTAANAFRIDVNQLAIDAGNNIYFGGDGTSAIWRAVPSGTTNYAAVTKFADGIPECEAVAVYPRPPGTLLILNATSSLSETYTGRDLTYTLAYENAGAASAASSLTFELPAGTTFVSATNNGTLSGNTVTWSLGTVASGATGTRSVTVQTTASAGATLNSTATVTGNGSTAVASLPPVAVLAPPQLNVSVAASAPSVSNNSHLLYTISYSNSGGAAAPLTVIRNFIPAGSAYVAAYDGGGLVNGAAVVWNLGTVPAGASGTVRFLVRATGAAGTNVNNNNLTIGATAVTTVLAAPLLTPITALTRLTTTLVVSPSPVIPGTQVNVFINYRNQATPAATNAILTAPLPPDSEFVSATGGGVAGGNSVIWTIPSVPNGANVTLRYSFRIHAEPGFQTFLQTTIRSDQHGLHVSIPQPLEVRQLAPSYVPGTVLTVVTWGNEHPLGSVSGNTVVPFGTVPDSPWAGSLLIPRNRHLYASMDTHNGAIYDVTTGGDLTTATPFVTDLGAEIVSLTSDPDGNIYALARAGAKQMWKITPEGEKSRIGPVISAPGAAIWLDGIFWMSEGGTGTVYKWDPVTNVKTTHATGFPTGADHNSGQFVRNEQGRVYILWTTLTADASGNRGLFDITEPLTWTASTPAVTAKGAFRGDVNQMVLGFDNSILFAGNGSNQIWRAPYVNGTYGPTTVLANDADDNEAIALVPRLDVSIAAAVSPSRALSGDVLTWTLTYRNESVDDLHHAYVETPLPSNALFDSIGDGGTFENGRLRWEAGTLAAGASGSVSFTTRVAGIEGASVTLSAYLVDGDEVIGAYGPAATVPIERPLAIDAAAEPFPAFLGQNVTFTLAYENLNANAATNAVVRAAVPAGSSYVSGGAFANGTVTFNLGTVPAGAQGTVSFVVRAEALPSIAHEDKSIATTH
jgi:uncharacterized repeat protein (TIGR01451 family)